MSSRHLLLVIVFCVVPTSARLVFADDIETRVTKIVAPFIKNKPYLGLVVGIVKTDGSMDVYGYGVVKDGGPTGKPTGKTLFEIGSVTKVFTGTVLANFVVQGKVKLDDPVQKHLPQQLVVPRHGKEQITLLQLATHSSSLPVQPPLIGFFALTTKDPQNPYAEFNTTHLAKHMSKLKLNCPIGSRVEYSNLGVGILGHALVNVAKAKSYEALIIERICKPLGMRDTRIQLSKNQKSRMAVGHSIGGKPTSPWDFASLEGCGAIRSTVHDMLIFARANLGHGESSLTAAFKLSHQPTKNLATSKDRIGLCWMCRDTVKPKRTVRWHNGGTGGYRSFLALDLDRKCGIVVLSNSAHFVDSIAIEILKTLEP